GTILLNDTDSPLTFRVRVRLSDGMVTSFSRGDVSQYVGELPAPDTVTTPEKAGELLAGPFELYVEYVWDSEREMAVLRYLPKARDDYYVDAATGELVNLTELRSLLNRGIKGNDMLFAPEAGRNEAVMDSAADDLKLSEAELAGVAKLEGVMTQEELGALVKGYKALGLDAFELVGASFSVYTPEIPVIAENGEPTGETQEGESQVTARLTFARNTEEGIARRHVTLDAKTGELFSMWGYNPFVDAEPTLTQEKAREAGLGFLKELWPQELAKTEVYTSFDASSRSGSFTFSLAQKENGYFYPNNSLTVSVDAGTGAVMAFSKSFDHTVTFESPEGMIGMEEALEIWADSFPVEFGYQEVPVALDLLGDEVMPLRNDGYTYYNALKPGYVYGERDGWYSGVNAMDGTLAGTAYEKEEPMAYDDIDGHWAQDLLNQLALYQVGWQGGKAMPDEALTQLAYLELLASSEGYHYTAEDADSLYQYAIRRGFLTEEERDENKTVTRGEMVRILLDCLGYKEFANFQGIFRCDFTDAGEIPEELMGYAAISQALGLVDGGDNGAFGADTPATRVQAAALLWKYMSK
ncbi:MAG: S-layer homology domain-containing protein, partial [Oscillospiraceae bacterium]|nr:S-layer homology domain-containing protein [Oscillospiraceae bacterium]